MQLAGLLNNKMKINQLQYERTYLDNIHWFHDPELDR